AEEGVEGAGAQSLADADRDVDVVAELLDPRGDRQHSTVGSEEVAGEEVEPGEAHSGVLDGSDERVDVAVGRDRLVGPGPPELDGVETGLPSGPGAVEQRLLGEQHRTVGQVAQAVWAGRRVDRRHHVTSVMWKVISDIQNRRT